MKGKYAFCPKSGAPLSEEVHYDELGRPRRVPERDGHEGSTQPEGELTNGSLRSSRIALFNHFRRCHRRHAESDSALYSKAALGVARLKRSATGNQAWDMYVWYALGEWLERSDYDVAWMNAHVEPRCPDCSGRLAYEELSDGTVRAQCGTDCTDDDADRLAQIRRTVTRLYADAFTDDEVPDEDDLALL